jgi:hypothetical protein
MELMVYAGVEILRTFSGGGGSTATAAAEACVVVDFIIRLLPLAALTFSSEMLRLLLKFGATDVKESFFAFVLEPEPEPKPEPEPEPEPRPDPEPPAPLLDELMLT